MDSVVTGQGAGGAGGLTVGSLFTGAAGMTRGFEQAGFTARWHAEIDGDASSVLRRHYRETPNWGSVENIHGGRVEPVDVLEGGSPCQDVSKAGTRAGLDGKRSGLFFEYVRIIGEMREATQGRYPAVAVLENVDGLLSSNDRRDFAVVLGRLQELGAAVAFRVLDAQFFGVPQRRRRVFVVADFAPVGVGEERAAQVLALREGLCGHPPPGDQAGQGLAVAAQDGAELDRVVCSESGPGWWREGFGCLRAEGENRPSRPSHVVLEPVAVNVRSGHLSEDTMFTLQAAMGHHGGSPNSGPLIVAPWHEAQITSAANRSRVEDGLPCPTLNGDGRVSIVAAEVASTVTGEYGQMAYRGDGSDNLIAECIAFDWQDGESGNDQSFRGAGRKYITRAGDYIGALGVTRQDAIVLDDGIRWIVRRLTPREGERCQGWPDDWTRWRDDGSEISDSARWRLIGNSVATPVAFWIAKRLRAALGGPDARP
jgi:DNA (cytosine-5)-methyltransferase 1